MVRRCVLLAAVWMAVLARADDWTTWRGPHGNGISDEKEWDISKAAKLWSCELGVGHSTVAVRGDRLYTMGNIDDKDIVYCLDSKTGKEIWRHSYGCQAGNYPGPRATPVIEGDAVYTVNRDGGVIRFDAASGKVVWETDVKKETGLEIPKWGVSSSAVIEKNLILLNIGATGVALDKATGKIEWRSEGGVGSYASVVVFNHAGRRCAAVFSADGLHVVEAATGKELAMYGWKTKYDINGADPLVVGDRIFITSGYDRGCAMLDFSTGELEKAWESDALRAHFSSAVFLDGFIYDIDGQAGKKSSLRCIAAADGSEKWSQPLAFGSLIAADGKLIVLEEDGRAHVFDAIPDGCKEIASFDTGLPKLCWTPPVLANGILYCRNDKGTLAAFNIGK